MVNQTMPVITDGYGEFLVYRVASDGNKVAMSDTEYEIAFSIMEEMRASVHEDRHSKLKKKIQEAFDETVQIGFIPRTLYELIYLQSCIQHEVAHGLSRSTRLTLSHSVLETDDQKFKSEASEPVLLEEQKKYFWQLCIFQDRDYEAQFSPRNELDFRKGHLVKIASKLNEIAVIAFQKTGNPQGFNFDEISAVYRDVESYFIEVQNKTSDLHQAIQTAQADKDDRSGIVAKDFADDVGPYLLGLTEKRHQEIVQKAIQLECSEEAKHSVILYRGSQFALDSVTKNSIPYSLSFGTSLYAGALYDPEATAFYYMRKEYLDAVCYVVPLVKLLANKTPFFAFNVHPLIQLMSEGEIFHARTKAWKSPSDSEVGGFYGASHNYKHSEIPVIMITDITQEKIEKAYQKYKDRSHCLSRAITS